MFTLLVVVRKKEGVCVEEFRRVWKDVYGPMYKKIPQVKSYQQFHLNDKAKDDADEPIDGVAILSFDSKEDMKAAWASDIYKQAAKVRESIMREKSLGVHVTSVDELVNII